MEKFLIDKSKSWDGIYLTQPITGYYNTYYVGFRQEGNPDFLNDLKNTFAYASQSMRRTLNFAKQKVVNCLVGDLPQIIEMENIECPLCICVPRSRANMHEVQMYFRKAVQEACAVIDGLEDGTTIIERVEHTCTTHLRNTTAATDGEEPYPGITEDTCDIDTARIRGRNIILVDDIYTSGCNIDEDCIQALFNAGAGQVTFYAIAYTKRY